MSLISHERKYAGRVINLDIDLVRFPDGSSGPLEMIRHPGASAVVPFLDEPETPDPRILLLRQFRHAAGDSYIWEIPAGRLDPGETPEACAARELTEEAGMVASRMVRLTTFYTTPGFTHEKIHLFMAVGLKEGEHRREHDEFMEVHTFQWSKVWQMMESGEICDGKTLLALFYARAFRGSGRP